MSLLTLFYGWDEDRSRREAIGSGKDVPSGKEADEGCCQKQRAAAYLTRRYHARITRVKATGQVEIEVPLVNLDNEFETLLRCLGVHNFQIKDRRRPL